MERTFRPKGTSVKAVQVSPDTIEYAAEWCAGAKVDANGFKVPTLDGVVQATMGDYIVRAKFEGFKVMSAKEFEDRYEPVRTTRSEA